MGITFIIFNPQTILLVEIMVPILQMGKVGLREAMQPTQSHTGILEQVSYTAKHSFFLLFQAAPINK